MLESKLPTWARPTLTRLMQNRWQEEKPSELDQQGEKQLRTVDWVVDTYRGYDEKPKLDDALGQPGVVQTGSTILHFGTGERGELEAVLAGKDRKGNDVCIFFEKDEQGIEAYSLQNLGQLHYLQGGRLDLAEGESFYLSGAVKP